MQYLLLITRKDGTVSKHYYDTYEDLDYNATFCRFSTNIYRAEGYKLGFLSKKKLFTIE